MQGYFLDPKRNYELLAHRGKAIKASSVLRCYLVTKAVLPFTPQAEAPFLIFSSKYISKSICLYLSLTCLKIPYDKV